jgi:hypothetical protein
VPIAYNPFLFAIGRRILVAVFTLVKFATGIIGNVMLYVLPLALLTNPNPLIHTWSF